MQIKWFFNMDRMVCNTDIKWFATRIKWFYNVNWVVLQHRLNTLPHESNGFWNTLLSNFSWPPYQLLWVVWTFIGQSLQIKVHAQKRTISADLCASKSNSPLLLSQHLGTNPCGVAQSRRKRCMNTVRLGHHLHNYFCVPPCHVTPCTCTDWVNSS